MVAKNSKATAPSGILLGSTPLPKALDIYLYFKLCMELLKLVKVPDCSLGNNFCERFFFFFVFK